MLITRNCMLTKSRLSRWLTSWLRRVTSWPGGVVVVFISTVLFLAAINYAIVTWCDPALCRMSGNVDVDALEDFLQRTSKGIHTLSILFSRLLDILIRFWAWVLGTNQTRLTLLDMIVIKF